MFVWIRRHGTCLLGNISRRESVGIKSSVLEVPVSTNLETVCDRCSRRLGLRRIVTCGVRPYFFTSPGWFLMEVLTLDPLSPFMMLSDTLV